ncbi:MAG: hypothetical protein JXA36_04825 [Coriobacteriia bacterium]|nr:hypothetical protein [Coriobacteriia bacterium]
MAGAENKSGHRLERAVGAVLLVVVVLASSAYIEVQRDTADILLAWGAVDSLSVMLFFETSDFFFEMPEFHFNEVASPLHLYLGSDTHSRSPVGDEIERAWLAIDTVSQLMRSVQRGEASPFVADIAGGERAMAEFPALGRTVIGSGGDRRFSDVDAAVKMLQNQAAADILAAQAGLELMGPYGPEPIPEGHDVQ